MQPENAIRTPQRSIAAALATADASGRVRFPGEDGGLSLGEMAQRDLDAALQLLADRAQYITGSSGAAIALRRGARNDMLCRASSGDSAPELGALLSTEFGLSGESVRTRQLLRCDDAARDTRVNREACEELGIASVVVMPVVHDDEVLGVFELFSGKAHAFGDRDFIALRRLSEMVETAVRLARVAEALPQRLQEDISTAAVTAESFDAEETVVEVEGEAAAPDPASAPMREWPKESAQVESAKAAAAGAVAPSSSVAPASATPVASAPQPTLNPAAAAEGKSGPRRLLWSLAMDIRGDQRLAEADQSHVPAMLRSLKKCEACGFPVSAGRLLCVECEEKKWRGQSRASRDGRSAGQAQSKIPQSEKRIPASADTSQTFRPGSTPTGTAQPPTRGTPFTSSHNDPRPRQASTGSSGAAVAAAPAPESTRPVGDTTPAAAVVTPVPEPPKAIAHQASASDLVLSAGLEPDQSWLSANRFIIIAIAVVGIVASVMFFLLH